MKVKTTQQQKNKVIHLNYLRYYPGRTVPIPLRYVNTTESGALKRGGFIMKSNRFVNIRQSNEDDIDKLPEFVNVDCGGLKLKDTVRRDRMECPEGYEWGDGVGEDWLVGTVRGRGRDVKVMDDV